MEYIMRGDGVAEYLVLDTVPLFMILLLKQKKDGGITMENQTLIIFCIQLLLVWRLVGFLALLTVFSTVLSFGTLHLHE